MRRAFERLSAGTKLLVPSFTVLGFLVIFGSLSLFCWIGQRTTTAIVVAGGVLAAMVMIGLVLSIFMRSVMQSSMKQAAEAARDVAAGNLVRRMAVPSDDELGRMARSFNTFLDDLQGTMVKAAEGGRMISFQANTLEQTSRVMSRGVGSIVAEVGSVAAASEEMASTSEEIARNCTVAAGSSANANQAAVEGESIIQGIVIAMDRIGERVKACAGIIKSLGERSDQVDQIAAIINEIADQTNLLALNAAIEAARAGEHGRGFAVVADEVRKLAERTADATKDIGLTIQAMQSETKAAVVSMEDGVREAEAGAEETEKSGNALKEILRQVNTLAEQINQIAVASEQQTSTTNEITGNIQKISQVMNDASENVRENSAASVQVATLSKELNGLLDKFRVEEAGAGHQQASRNQDEAMDLVRKAALYLTNNGKQKAYAEFSNAKGRFVQGELYVFVNDMQGMTCAHGQNQALVGKNMRELKDVDGKHFIREMIDLARTKGSGWVDYKWLNQETGKVHAKSTYVTRVDDVYIGCGIYK